jgi:outer membrane lipoprotein SlyB
MTTPNPTASTAPGSAAAPGIPRNLWLGIGAVVLVGAGMAGGLAMRGNSGETAPAVPATLVNQQPAPAAVTAPAVQAAPVAPAATPAVAAAPTPAPVPATTSAAAEAAAPVPPVAAPVPAPVCKNCGVVESVQAVKVKGEGSGVGAVAGGVLGGVLGNQVGGGSGKTAMTVLGAAGGAYAGHQVEKNVNSTTVYSVQLRMDDGSVRTLQQSVPPAVGAKVRVEGSTLRAM